MPTPDLTDRTIEQLVSLRGKAAVVTGGAKGLGRTIARRLAEAGAAVLIPDIDEGGARATADEIAADFGVVAKSTVLDVSDSASVSATADFAVSELGSLDIWVNNAGIYPSSPVLQMADDEWDRVIGINLRGTFIGCREAARRMVAAGRGGVIVNLSSRAGYRGSAAGITHYVASKFGVRGITQQIAVEFGGQGIRCMAVAPTRTVTPGTQSFFDRPPSENPSFDGTVGNPLGRPGVPDDIARVVLFCASDLSSFMTGSTLIVDAGDMSR